MRIFWSETALLRMLIRSGQILGSKTPMLSAVVKDPESGLPMFFNDFKDGMLARQPELDDQQIIEAWRGLQ